MNYHGTHKPDPIHWGMPETGPGKSVNGASVYSTIPRSHGCIRLRCVAAVWKRCREARQRVMDEAYACDPDRFGCSVPHAQKPRVDRQIPNAAKLSAEQSGSEVAKNTQNR